jgi:hypothetical protein
MMRSAQKIVRWVFVVTVIMSATTLLLPLPPGEADGQLSPHVGLAISTILTTTYIGVIVLFVLGSLAYKKQLRKAYVLMVLGLALITLGLVQFTLLRVFDLRGVAWLLYSIAPMLFIISAISVYSGVRRMLSLLEVRTLVARPIIVVSIAVVVGVLGTFLPSPPDMPDAAATSLHALASWNAIMFIAAMLGAWRVSRAIGSHYRRAMTWLAVGLTCTTATNITMFALLHADGMMLPVYLHNFLVFVGGLVYLRAGYEFALTKEI